MHEEKRGSQIRQDYLCCDSFVEYLLLFGDFVHSAASSPLPGSPCSALPHSNPCVCAGHNKSVWRFCWFTVCLCWSGPEEGLCWRQFPTTHQLCCGVLWDTREECSYTQDQSQNSGAIISLTLGTLTSFPPSLWRGGRAAADAKICFHRTGTSKTTAKFLYNLLLWITYECNRSLFTLLINPARQEASIGAIKRDYKNLLTETLSFPNFDVLGTCSALPLINH